MVGGIMGGPWARDFDDDFVTLLRDCLRQQHKKKEDLLDLLITPGGVH
jgi:hypothetical protein